MAGPSPLGVSESSRFASDVRTATAVRRAGDVGRPVVVVILTVLLVSPWAAADDDLSPSTEQVTERTLGFESLWLALRARTAGLRIRGDEALVTSGEFDGARTWWLRSRIAIEGGLPIGGKVAIGLSPFFGWERLVIEGADEFLIARGGRDTALTDFFESGLRAGLNYEISDRWGAELVTGFSARHEEGASYREALQTGGSFALTYRRGSWLRLRLGMGIGADPADGRVRVSPAYRVRLRPVDRITLEASGLSGSVEWEATPRTTFSIGGGQSGTQYTLDRRGLPPVGSGEGTLQRRQSQVEVGLVHRLREDLRLRADLGLVVDEELSVLDEGGVEVDRRRERDPSVALRLGFTLSL